MTPPEEHIHEWRRTGLFLAINPPRYQVWCSCGATATQSEREVFDIKEPPLAQTHEFTCPLCGQETEHHTTLAQILLSWVRCTKCGREFLVEDEPPSTPAQ